MGSENENEISDHLRKDPAVALDEGDFLIPGKRSSASSSSSSDSSDSSIEDLFQVDVNEQPESTSLDIGFPELVSGDVNEKPKSTTLDIGSPELAADIESASIDVDKDDSGNSSPKSEKSVEESAGPSLPAEVPSLIPDSILHSELPMQSPPVQLMGRSEDYNPFRIPPSVFERSKSTTPMEWSVASNESLFSIHVGNNSFSRDHVFLLGRSGELGNSGELTKSDEFINFPMSPPEAAAAAAKEEDLGITEAAAETMKAVLKATEEDRGKKDSHPAEVFRNSSGNSHRSDGSGTSTRSFAFPIKKKRTWPFCYGSNGRRAFCYFTWPICYCSNRSRAFRYYSNCSRTSICCFATSILTGEGGKAVLAKRDPEPQQSPLRPSGKTPNSAGTKWLPCLSCCTFCH